MWLSIGLYMVLGTVLLGLLGIMVLHAMAEHQERQSDGVLTEGLNLCKQASPANAFANQTECRY